MKKVFLPAPSRIASVTALVISVAAPLYAQDVWNGLGTDNNWTTAANWQSGTAPVAGDVLQFQGSARTTNNNDFITSFDSITFNSGAAAFNLGGNTVGLGNGITNNSTNLQTLSFSGINSAPFQGIFLGDSETFNAASGDLGIQANVEPFLVPVALTITGAHNTTITGVVENSPMTGASLALIKNGTGTLRLDNHNTYSGGTTINNGTLVVNNFNALGNRSVNLHDGTLETLTNSPRAFFVGTNYTQDFGTLRIQIGGTSPSFNSDVMEVNPVIGTATLSTGNFSTLFLHRIFNFNPVPGDMVLIIVSLGNPITTTFDNVTNDFPGLVQPMVIYNPNDVTVDFELSATFLSQALTPNQIAVAGAIDHAFADLCLSNNVRAVLGSIPLASLPHSFDLIAPEELAAMYEISFSRAVVQSGNLQGRMDQIRANADPDCGPIVEINPAPEGKNVVGKNVVAPAPAPDNRLGTFAMGSGQYVTVHNQDDNAAGYKITNGSFLAGVDYRLLHDLAIGVYGGYVGSESNLVGRGRITADGGTAGGYATFFSHGFYLQAAGGGNWNSYENRRDALFGQAHGSTNGSELNAMGALGYDWTMNFNAANHPGSLTVGPIASVQYTNVDINGYSETGSLIPLEFPGQSEDSLRSTIGGKVAICLQTDHGIMLRPEARVAWLHEYNDRAYPIDARFLGCDDLFTVHGPTIGRDAAQVTAGLTVQFNPMVALFAHYDGIFGRDNYDSNGVSGGLALSF